MDDSYIIQVMRHCGKFSNDMLTCKGCPADGDGCANAYLATADRLEALLAENELPKWISVEERLPENEKDVLIAFVRKSWRGDVYRCVGMAFHTDGKTTTEDSSYTWEVGYIDMEYNEETDGYIIPEGWWETVNFGETFSAVDMPVTHWMPLPSTEEVPHENP